MKVVFCTVVYPQAWKWHREFAEALNKQKYNDFELLIVNDGVESHDVDAFCKLLNYKCKVINIQQKLTISQIRIEMLKTAKDDGIDLAILGDFDDLFDEYRVQEIIAGYDSKYSFFYHDLKTESGEIVFTELPEQVNDVNQIMEENFLGLSNTAINLDAFEQEFFHTLKNVNTNVFDWYLYAKILASDRNGKRIYNAYTIYRQQENNIAGAYQQKSENLGKEISIKLEQYRLLADDLPVAGYLYDIYSRLQRCGLNEQRKYLNHQFKGYWWSNLKIIKEEK